MSHWNYRVLKQVYAGDQGNEEYFGIHEVYYDDNDKPHSCSTDAMRPFGETVEELQRDLELMQKAFEKPVLDYILFSDMEKDVEEVVN